MVLRRATSPKPFAASMWAPSFLKKMTAEFDNITFKNSLIIPLLKGGKGDYRTSWNPTGHHD
jgi:hypothetical protein